MNSFNAQFFDENGKHIVTLDDVTRLNDLLKTRETLRRNINHGFDLETADQLKALRDDLGELPDVPSVFRSFPVFPLTDEAVTSEKQKTESSKKLLIPIAGVTAGFLLLYFIFHWDLLLTPCVLGIFASLFFGSRYAMNNKAFQKAKAAYDASVETYRRSIEAFRAALSVYDREKEGGRQSAERYEQRYRQTFLASLAAVSECDKKKEQAQAEFDTTQEQIIACDFAPADYHRYIPAVCTLMQSGRADSYKEALNMAIKEEERRIEAEERRAEEQRQAALLERQLAEERRHNLQMEHDAQMARKEAQDMEYQRQRAQEKQEQQARREQSDAQARARREAQLRCQKCVNASKCSASFKGNPNCAGFRPR